MTVAICPVGSHEFTYDESKRGRPPAYCSPKHQMKAASDRAIERNRAKAERQCGRCKLPKPVADFAGPSAPYCRPCTAAYARAQRAANPDPLRGRRDSLARYGLTFEQFDAMLAAQGGKCTICGTAEPGGTGRDGPRGWHIDHDHACCNTRKRSCGKCVRGIVCSNCNLGLGNFREDPVVLRAALDYLAAYQARRAAEGHINSMMEIDAAVTP